MSCLSLQSVGITGVHAQAKEVFLCFTVCVFLSTISSSQVTSLKHTPFRSVLSGWLVVDLAQHAWSLVVDPQNKEKEKEGGRFLQDFLTIFLGQFSLCLVISCLSPYYPQDSKVSICLLKCNFRRVERCIMYANLQKYLV